MAQFDVHANPSATQRDGFPFFVVIQNEQLDHLATRLVMPLQRLAVAPKGMPRRLSQAVSVQGEQLWLAPHQCASWPTKLLKRPIANIAAQADTVRDALDAVISGV